MEYVYHMRDPKGALLFLQDLHRELMDIWRSGIIFLLKDGVTDWYVFINVDPAAGSQMDTLLSGRGGRPEWTVDELAARPSKVFMSSGTFEQVMADLDAFGDVQRDLHTRRVRSNTELN